MLSNDKSKKIEISVDDLIGLSAGVYMFMIIDKELYIFEKEIQDDQSLKLVKKIKLKEG